jgi:two-component system CheB/CheR fusion protein
MSPSDHENKRDPRLEALLEFIKENRGFDFTGYKRSSLTRRITKRMQAVNIDNFADYRDYLEVTEEEFTHLFNTILINVTKFFRDPDAWEFLATEVIPGLIARKSPHEQIRCWSVGCASGEEAYTIAMVLAEALEKPGNRIKIYATDVDEEALAHARHGVYTAENIESVPPELRKKYFEPAGDKYVLSKELRRCVIFGVNNVVQNAPISRLDLLVCRNTLMYFNAETQNRIVARFHFALNNDGVLFLGKAETMLSRVHLFQPIDLKRRIFRKVSHALREQTVMAAVGTDVLVGQTLKKLQLSEAAFDASPVAQLVLDRSGTLRAANREATKSLEIDVRDVGRPFCDLSISYRPIDLRKLIEEAVSSGKPVVLREVERQAPDAPNQFLDIYVTPILGDESDMTGVLLTFTDQTHCKRLESDLARMNQELETANEELQSANEELETTNEELQSANEELETTNEELQSSNEEMETMNEELQATNEELQTINDELRERTDMLNQSNAIIESVLDGLRLGVVVVDEDIKVLSWNNQLAELWGLRADEVKGQSFLNLDIGLPMEQIKKSIRAVLDGEGGAKQVMLDARDRRGRKLQCQVTCNPLVGGDKEVKGVVMLMEERRGTQEGNG